MPTIRGYGGGQPKRTLQLHLKKPDAQSSVRLRFNCPKCGASETISALACDYYKVGFRAQCPNCGAWKP